MSSVINESSLSRIRHHVENGNGFIILSAFKHEYYSEIADEILNDSEDKDQNIRRILSKGEKENKTKTEQLKKDLLSLGYHYIEIDGNYSYSSDISSDRNISIENVHVEEESLLVPFPLNLNKIKGSRSYGDSLLGFRSKFKAFIVKLGGIAQKLGQESILICFPRILEDQDKKRVVGYYVDPKHKNYNTMEDWGSRFYVGEGVFGTSRLKKGSHGRKVKKASDDTSAKSDFSNKDAIRNEGDKKVIDFSKIKLPKDNGGYEKGIPWSIGESLSDKVLKKFAKL